MREIKPAYWENVALRASGAFYLDDERVIAVVIADPEARERFLMWTEEEEIAVLAREGGLLIVDLEEEDLPEIRDAVRVATE